MGNANKPTPRWLAMALVLVIAGGLVAWELIGARRAQDAGLREVAIVLTADGPYPDVLYVERGVRYRIAITSVDEEYTLTGITAADGEGRGRSAGNGGAGQVTIMPGRVTWIDAAPDTLEAGRRFGGVGPVIERVDNLATLASQGFVYPLAVVADADGLIPRQVRLAEGVRAAVGGVSLDGPRMLNISGTNVHLALWPGELIESVVDAPRAGTYQIVCEQGCSGRWSGAFRVEAADTDIPWVEAKSTDAVGELNGRAPDFAVYDLDGRVVQLSDYRGDKPVFLNFWATWCPPCKREMPAMQQLYVERGDELEILAVNFLEHRPLVEPFVEELGLEFPILLDVTGEVSERYSVWSYPTSLFIDKDGIVRGRFIGELSYQMMEDFVDMISEYMPGDA